MLFENLLYVRVVVSIVFFLSVASHLSKIQAAEIPKPYDSFSQLRQLDLILEKRKPFYQITILDLFEGKRRYIPYASSGALIDIRAIEKIPEGRSFLLEKKIFRKYLKKPSFEKSLMIYTSFRFPGRQNLVLKTKTPPSFQGRLLGISLWVHSRNYPHHLFLLFKSAKSEKEIKISVGELSWKGWRRLSLDHTNGNQSSFYNSFVPNRIIEKKQDHHFLGLMIVSSVRAKNATVEILLDHLTVLTDQKDLMYSGSEIRYNEWNKP